jgi:hypothetical protein
MSDTDKLLKQLVMRSERRAEQAEETRLAMLDQLKSIELNNEEKLTQIERHLWLVATILKWGLALFFITIVIALMRFLVILTE